MSVGSNELLNFVSLNLESELGCFFRCEVSSDHQEASHLLLKGLHVLLHLLGGDLCRRRDAARMQDATPIRHLIFIRIFRVVVEVDRVDDSQIQDHFVQHSNQFLITLNTTLFT